MYSFIFIIDGSFLTFFRDSLAPPQLPTVSTNVLTKHQQSQAVASNINCDSTVVKYNNVNNTNNLSPVTETDSEWVPPRALYPTDWKVRPSSAEEREEFRRQENMRYAAPHKSFTYRMHGYSSVVGPVKGIYQHNIGEQILCPLLALKIFNNCSCFKKL